MGIVAIEWADCDSQRLRYNRYLRSAYGGGPSMKLDDAARAYADSLFHHKADALEREFEKPVTSISQAATKGRQLIEGLASARAETLSSAYHRARLRLDEDAVNHVLEEVRTVCDVKASSITAELNAVGQRAGIPLVTFKPIISEINMEVPRIVDRCRQALLERHYGEILDARSESAGEAVGELDKSLGIFTKSQLENDLKQSATVSKESGLLCLIFIDIDRFKEINDKFSHAAGDEVLKGVASAILAACSGKGRCYRFGGDEIVVLLANYTLAEAMPMAERLRDSIRALRFSQFPNAVSASIGVAGWPETSSGIHCLQHDADVAMYRGKNDGGGHVCFAPQKAATVDSIS
jgi:diguanylate cyclase (GGDEF)-like protein